MNLTRFWVAFRHLGSVTNAYQNELKTGFWPKLVPGMGKKVDRWTAERALPPDLSAYRPAGMAEDHDRAAAIMAERQRQDRTQRVQSRQLAQEVEPIPVGTVRGGAVARQRGTAGAQLRGQGLHDAKQRFLELYAERGTMVECCRIAGLSWRAVDNARENDPIFAQAYQEAEQCVLEKLEREAMRRAVDGTVIRSRKFWHGELVGEDVRTEYSDTLLQMLLRARAPERYRDNSLITINQVIKAVEGFNPAEVLGLPAPVGA